VASWQLKKSFKTFIYLTEILFIMDELELKYDSKKVKEFTKKYGTILLILIPIFLAIFFRAYPYSLPITDQTARDSMENNIKAQIQNEIITQAQDIDQNTLNTLTNQRYQSYVSENKEIIEEQTKLLSDQIKQFYKDDSGQTYLLAIDPYHYLRQTDNILENGHVGDELIDGTPHDNHMLAPNGRTMHNSFHPYITAQLHKISQVFGNDSTLKTIFIIPLIFAALAVIPAFFITRKITGKLGATVAAVTVAIHQSFLGRTPAGFADTDAYTIFFPLVIVWLFLESFTRTNSKQKYIFGSLAGLATGLFAFAWGGWWYLFDILVATLGIYFIYLLIKYKKNVFKKIKTKNLIKTTISYLASSTLFVILFTSVADFLTFYRSPMGVIFIKQAAHSTLWPNVYTTVAELNTITLPQVINALGGKLLFGIAALGILLVFLKKKKLQTEIKYGILLLVWFAVTLYTSTKGARFVMYAVPIFAIGLGIFYGRIYTLLTNYGSKELDLNKKLLSISLIVLTILSFVPMVKTAHQTALYEVPSFTDSWYTALTKIKEETPENSIVNSWWDFGHWFKYWTDRAVTFDGASQDTPPAHWIGKTMLTSNEDESIAILRMLDCGSNDAYDLLLEESNDPLLTKKTIDKIILQEKNTAKNTLLQYTDNPDQILEKTHCQPPEDYFITSEDMVSKAGVWAHFGSWDFERAYAYNTVKENNKETAIAQLQEKLTYSQEEAESTFRQLNGLTDQEANQWIAPYPSYSNIGQCYEQNTTIACSNGIVIENNRAYAQSEQGAIEIKHYRDDKQIYTSEEGTEEIAVAYVPKYQTVMIMDPALLGSTFTELYFYEGQNLNNFELFDFQQGTDGFRIYTWKVKWT